MRQNDIELRWILHVILRRKWMILGFALIGMIIAAAFVFTSPLTYKASVRLVVEPSKDTRSNEYDTLAAAERLAYTYSQMMKNTRVVDEAIRQTGLDISPEMLMDDITAEPINDTHLILLTVVGSSPKQAADLVNAVANSFISYNQEMQMQKYTGSLTDNERKMDELKTSIEETQLQYDNLTSKRENEQIQLNVLQENLSVNKSDYRLLQKRQEELKQKLNQVENHITVAEIAQPSQAHSQSLTNIVTTTLLINQNPVVSGDDYSSILAGERLASTYSQVLISRPIVEAAIQTLGLQDSYQEVFDKLRVMTLPDTLLLKLMVRDVDPIKAAFLANAIAQEFISETKTKYKKNYDEQISALEEEMDGAYTFIAQMESEISSLSSSIVQEDVEISRLENLIDGYQNDVRALEENDEQIRMEIIQAADSVVLVEPAAAPKQPVQNRILYILLAGMIGAMLGVVVAFGLQNLNNKINSPEDVNEVLGPIMVDSIGRLAKSDPDLYVLANPNTLLAEQFQVLSTRIRNALASNPNENILLISSPTASEGKSFIAANLALTLASAGLRVVLIDADLRKPRIHELFGIEKSKGLEILLSKKFEVKDLSSTEVDGLKLLAGGEENYHPTQVLNSPHLTDFLNKLKQNTDLILMDCPPILFFADTQILSAHVNGILLVVRYGKTINQAVKEAYDILSQTGIRLIGVVLNDIPGQIEHYYYSRYYQTRNSKKNFSLFPQLGLKVRNFLGKSKRS